MRAAPMAASCFETRRSAVALQRSCARGRVLHPALQKLWCPKQGVTDMNQHMDRRRFIGSLGMAATVGASACIAAPRAAGAVAAKGKIPATPFKLGHMTFQSGPGAALGAPALKGHTLAAAEINAEGGFLGARKLVPITADAAAG